MTPNPPRKRTTPRSWTHYKGRYSLRFHNIAIWERKIILAKARKMGSTNRALKAFVKWLKKRGEKPATP